MAGLVLLAGAIVLAAIFSGTGDTREVKGVMTGLNPMPGRDQNFLEVRLDDGTRVSVLLPPGVAPSSGGRVTLLETTTYLFGGKKFTFLRFGN